MKGENSTLRIVPQKVDIKFNPLNIIPVSYDLKVYNISGKKQRVLILPQQSKYFEIKGPKSGLIIPGFALHLKITFCATCSRVYKDWFSISCEDEDNLVVELTAVPDLSHLITLPQLINFGTVHLGKKITSKITLSPIPGEQLSFLFVFARPNPDCKICPIKGRVKNEPIEIEIIYTPTAYITLDIPVQLYLPLVSATPYYFKIFAVTKPGTIRDDIIPDVKVSSTNEFKNLSKVKPKIKGTNKVIQNRKQMKMQLKIPQLTIHDTNLMLLRKSEWPKDNDILLGPFGRDVQDDLARKHDIESIFLKKVENLKKENTKALSHHRTKLTDSAITHETIQEIIDERITACQELKDSLQPNYEHTGPQHIKQRTIRNLNRNLDLRFSIDQTNNWFVRFQTHKRFVDVIRRVLIHNRLLKRLEILKMLTSEDVMNYE